MASQKIILGETLTIDDPNLEFDIASEKSIDEQGNVQFVEWTIDIEVDAVGTLADGQTPTGVYNRVIALNNEVVAQFAAKRIQIQLDGVDKIDLQASTAFIGPVVSGFRTFREEGAGESHWRCAFSIFMRGRGSPNSDVYEFTTSISVEKVNGEIVRKTWAASAKSGTSASALAKVLTFKPGEPDVKERISRFFQEARADAVWVWEARRSEEKILSWKCVVTCQGAGVDYVEDRQVGVSGSTPKDPNLFLATRGACVVMVQGTIIGYDPAMTAPAPHFEESDTLKRVPARERTMQTAAIENDVLGTYRLDYEEVWLNTAISVPNATHEGDHHLIVFKKPPGDGGAAS